MKLATKLALKLATQWATGAVSWARRVTALLVVVSLCGCAAQSPRLPMASAPPLHDDAFRPPARPLDPARVFDLSPEMRQYAQQRLAPLMRSADPRRALIEQLYRLPEHGGLQLRYDTGSTRNAAEAFADRAGNCLSLVIMTAAFARHFGLPVRFQSVRVPEVVSRSGDLTFVSGHANLMLGGLRRETSGADGSWLVVDFLPGADIRRQLADEIPERTVLAMYMNNRAAEWLADGQLDEAYWAARDAIGIDPVFLPAANTLAVVYLHRGLLDSAETTLRQLLAADTDNISALSNLVNTLGRQGRAAEAEVVFRRLQALQPYPPFHFHDLGMAALARGEPEAALAHFRDELRRHPDQAESHHGLAQAYWLLGDTARAARHLAQAVEHSTTLASRSLYADKLARLRGATRLQ